VKRILIIAATLVLLAMLAVPMAAFAVTTGDTTVTGSIVAPTISVTAPGTLDFDQFTYGVEKQVGPTTGSVTVVPGSATNVNWTVTATDAAYGNGYMYIIADGYLSTPLLICVDGSTWHYANVNAAVSGSDNGTFDFYAKQTVVTTDAAGSYTDTIVFSVAITSFN
jgi:spore coat protein U-like protein